MAETNPSAAPDRFDLMSRLETDLLQLRAQLLATHGNCGQGFRLMADEQQDAYLWATHDGVVRAQETLKALWRELASREPAGGQPR